MVHVGHTLAKITSVKNDVCRFWHFPSNGAIIKIALRDTDLLYGGQILKKNYISETVRASAKMCRRDCRFLYLPSMGVIVNIALHDIYFLFGGKKCKIVIAETVRASAKLCRRHL